MNEQKGIMSCLKIEAPAIKIMTITVATKINAPVGKVWEFWTKPEHIVMWNFASDDWCCPKALNDLRQDGRFLWRMEAKDGSIGFDFTGKYLKVTDYQKIEYLLDDGRNVTIEFHKSGSETTITETFEAEDKHSLEMQRDGWQNILNNFKKYIES
ncbi:MAG: SRPBCC family protein [Bacteroidales bacterium]|jgi:uncharacterized protein YndB with AHSA1/START domain|nr:SRPBCC family protein [Bacteroidales bacterium]